jgi:RNA polymerase sigma-70 factor, ECF subfamily
MSDFADALAQQIPRLRRYARALVHDAAWADDLVQDTLERALQRRWLFRINTNLTAWLFTMLYRLYLNDVTRRRALPSLMEEEAPEVVADTDLGLQIDMQRALARLSTEHRAVIVLIGLEQLSYQEAAELLGIPIGTVMSRLTRARAQLRTLLSGKPLPAATATHLTRIK